MGVWWLAVALVVSVATWAGLNPFARWRLRKIPGPAPLPFVGNLPTIAARDLTAVILDWSKQYGRIFKFFFGSQPWVIISDPELIRKVAYKCLSRPFDRSNSIHMLSGEAYDVDANTLVFMRNGPEWRLARRAFETSVVHPSSLASHVPAVQRCIARALPRLDRHVASGEPLDLTAFLGELTLSIVGEVAYGVDFGSSTGAGEVSPAAVGGSGAAAGDAGGGVSSQLVTAVKDCFTCSDLNNVSIYQPFKWIWPGLTPLWFWLAEHLPDKNQLRHMAARERLAQVSRQLMAQWQASKQRAAAAAAGGAPAAGQEDRGSSGASPAAASTGPSFAEVGGGISSSSFLASLLEGRRGAQQHDRLTDVQVIAQCLIFLMAGFETTSATIAFTLFLIMTHPEVQQRLQQEADQHAQAGAPQPGEPLPQLPYLEAVLQESMRLYPAASTLIREPPEDLDLGGGVVVPKGTPMLLATHAMMHDPAVWPQPEAFLPQRFLPGQSHGQGLLPGGAGQGAAGGEAGPGSAWAPFGLGPRMCVGNKFATLVAKAVVLQLVRRYTFSVHEKQVLEDGPRGKQLRTRTDLSYHPRDGVRVLVQGR